MTLRTMAISNSRSSSCVSLLILGIAGATRIHRHRLERWQVAEKSRPRMTRIVPNNRVVVINHLNATGYELGNSGKPEGHEPSLSGQ